MSNLTLGSLFDGQGGWLIAAVKNGVKPIWKCEWDVNPASVAHKHFPDVKQYGDIQEIKVDELEPVDIICAGSPCQDLSVAGKRAGLNGERSGLFRTAVELVHGMRNRTNGKYPKYFVWENVPGAFTSGISKGADFRCVLEEIGQTEIPIPPDGRWATSGVAELPSCRIEWRVLDPAELKWLPQRRKRVFLVADFTAPQRGGREVLFESESVRRHSSESRSTGQGAATEAGSSSQSAGTTYCLDQQGGKGQANFQKDVACTLCSDSHGTPHAVASLLGEHHKDNPLTIEDGRSL